jgi:plasmid stability protein
MAAVLVRDLSSEEHRALKARAAKNGRSISAEIRAIVHEAVLPEDRLKLGTALAEFGKKYAREISQIDFDALRDKTPAGGVSFE